MAKKQAKSKANGMPPKIERPWPEDPPLIPIPVVEFRETRDPLAWNSGLPDTIETVAEQLWITWLWTTNFNNIDDPESFGSLEFWLDGERVCYPLEDLNEGQIAIAKFDYLASWWSRLLANPLWAKVKSYPPATVFRELVECLLDGAKPEAIAILNNEIEPYAAPDCLKARLRDFVRVVEPTFEMFFASLRVEKIIERPATAQKTELSLRDREFLRMANLGMKPGDIAREWNRMVKSQEVSGNLVSANAVSQQLKRLRERFPDIP